MLQGDAIREITLEGPGRRRHRDRVGRVADMVSVDRHDGHRLPPERPRAGARCRGCRRASSARRSTSTSRSTTGRACSRASPRSSPSARSRSRGSSSTRTATAPRSTSSPTRRASGRVEAALAAIRRCPRCAARRCAMPGHLRPRRRGARLGVTRRLRPSCHVFRAASSRVDRSGRSPSRRRRRRSCRSARARRRCSRAPRLSERLGVEL